MRDINKEVQLPNGIAAPNPLSNIDYYYGVHNSIQDALTNIPFSLRAPGRTAGIKMSVPDEFGVFTDKIVEYWWNSDDMSDGGFKPKGINLLAGDGIIIDNVNGGYKISAPKEADTSIKSFYVNETYTGGGSTFKGDGSILKPFKKLIYALMELIGPNGTLLSPRYQGAKIILQSNATVSKQDLDDNPILEGQLSINTLNISSDENYRIYYEGTVDYFISTNFLLNKASSSGFTGGIYLNFKNISIQTQTVKGVLYFKTIPNFSIQHSLENVTIAAFYKINDPSYKSFSPKQYLFGGEILGEDTITNDTPTVLFEGMNQNGLGSVNLSGKLSIQGTSQTYIRFLNTTCSLGTLDLQQNSYRVSTDSITTKKPKTGLYRLENIDSWVYIENLICPEECVEVGGTDTLIKIKGTTYNNTKVIALNGSIYHSVFNNILRCNDTTGTQYVLQNCFFSSGSIILDTVNGSFYNELGPTIMKGINVDDSQFKNVKKSSICGIEMQSSRSNINNAFFSNCPYYPDNNAATTDGKLIAGNFYRTADGSVKQYLG